MSVVYGFGGMRIHEGLLSFDPRLPEHWKSLAFHILFRGRILKVILEHQAATVENRKGEGMDLFMAGRKEHLEKGGTLRVEL